MDAIAETEAARARRRTHGLLCVANAAALDAIGAVSGVGSVRTHWPSVDLLLGIVLMLLPYWRWLLIWLPPGIDGDARWFRRFMAGQTLLIGTLALFALLPALVLVLGVLLLVAGPALGWEPPLLRPAATTLFLLQAGIFGLACLAADPWRRRSRAWKLVRCVAWLSPCGLAALLSAAVVAAPSEVQPGTTIAQLDDGWCTFVARRSVALLAVPTIAIDIECALVPGVLVWRRELAYLGSGHEASMHLDGDDLVVELDRSGRERSHTAVTQRIRVR